MRFVEKAWEVQRRIEVKLKKIWKWKPNLWFAIARWIVALYVCACTCGEIKGELTVFKVAIWLNYIIIFHIIFLSFNLEDYNRLTRYGKE